MHKFNTWSSAAWLVLCSTTAGWSCTGDAYLGAEPLLPKPSPRTTDASSDAAAASGGAQAHADAAVSDAGTRSASAALDLAFVGGTGRLNDLVITCPDTCAELELAASGGTAPYGFVWEDGMTAGKRTICPNADAPLRATVRDAHGDERSATLPVRRVPCNVGRVCADNASFEGSPILGTAWLGTSALSASAWDDCRATGTSSATNLPRVVDSASGDEFPAASEGNTYLYLPARGNSHAAVSQALCEPLLRGSMYAFKVDLAYAAEDRTGVPLEPGRIEVYASSNQCQRDALLWTSPSLRTAWRTYCIAFAPQQSANALLFTATGPAGADAAVFIDHLIPVTSCP